MPPTFQSWFTVTNLHVWLLTARLRALPRPAGQDHIQGLIDHFFLDVEDRIRLVLAPAPKSTSPGSTPTTVTKGADGHALRQGEKDEHGLRAFYTPRNTAYTYSREGAPMPLRAAPERLVSQQMRVFKEQWAGLGMSLDLALVRGDAELAGALWRNVLGGRGARGIILPGDPGAEDPGVWFRRSVNLVGGDTRAVRKVERGGGLEVAEREDDNSGVHDYPPSEVRPSSLFNERCC